MITEDSRVARATPIPLHFERFATLNADHQGAPWMGPSSREWVWGYARAGQGVSLKPAALYSQGKAGITD
jgi:hypothetical protein